MTKAVGPLRTSRLMYLYFLSATLYLSAAVSYVLYTERLSMIYGKNLFAERTTFTQLSSLQIGMIGLLLLSMAIISLVSKIDDHQPSSRRANRASVVAWLVNRPAFFWLMGGLFFFYLAVDEFYELHESGGWLLAPFGRLGIEAGPFWGEIAVLALYVPVLLLVAWQSWLLFRRRWWRVLLSATGVILLLLSLLVDQYLWPLLPVFYEDGLFKFIGFSFIFAAYFDLVIGSLLETNRVRPIEKNESWIGSPQQRVSPVSKASEATQKDAFEEA